MSVYQDQGTGENRLPHLLIAEIDTHWHSGIVWRMKCPYDGPRDCGLVEECNGTPEDVEKWGCSLFPTPPSDYGDPGPDSEENRQKWSDFEAAREEWEDEHGGRRWHRTDECWYEKVALPNSDFEPEYFLADIPSGTPLNGPLKVLVGYEGSDEDTEPKFKLWKEPTDAQTS